MQCPVMRCEDAHLFVSALHDGEAIPQEVADHIICCAECQRVRGEYLRMATAIRLVAAQTRKNTFLSDGKILVPRFAVAVAAGVVLVLTAGLIRVYGEQNHTLWVTLSMNENGVATSPLHPAQVMRAGYDNVGVWGSDPNHITAFHLSVLSVRKDRVKIALRARRYRGITNADQIDSQKDLGDLTGHEYSFVPGGSLEVPVEGGPALVIHARVADRQPKFLFGSIPLEPAEDQIVVSSPVLVSENKVLVDMKGATAVNEGMGGQIAMYVPGTGLFKVGLAPFPGSAEGNAEWGRLEIKWQGRPYSLLTSSPITGGEQPHKVWIKLGADFHPFDGADKSGFLSTDNVAKPVW